jgi:glycosyltransferase involved in cell wall biosynthesis
LKSLYICYLSVEDPLVQTQVVAYLEGLAGRGHEIHLLSFEPKIDANRRRELADDLKRRGISWHTLRYHRRPSLPATIYDALIGAFFARRLIRRNRLDVVHARSHVPAATGLIVRRLTGCRMIFDIRGLLGEEYVDAGRWRRGGLAHRLTNWVQARAIAQADGIVVLTERVRRHLFGEDRTKRVVVIPCCVDLDRLAGATQGADSLRDQLGLNERSVMVYVGKLTAPYMDREMVEFFAVARRAEPELAFLVLTQAPPESIEAEFERAAIDARDFRITRAAPDELGTCLQLADLAICFCRPTFARIASSPTKIAEYLAAGLPVVSGPDIGDVDALVNGRAVGAIVDSFSPHDYERAAAAVQELRNDSGCAVRCRSAAEEEYELEAVGVARYDRLYREIAGLP